MTFSAPRFRRDLTVSEVQTAGERVVVAKDPRSGKFFRLRETEAFISEQLDGETPLEVVRARTEERFGATLQPAELQAFVRKLERQGLLEIAGKRSRRRSRRKSRLRGSFLYLRYALFDPDPFLGRLLASSRWMFTPQFVVGSAMLIVLGAAIVIGDWELLGRDLAGLYRISTLPLLILAAFAIGTAHELAHGVTCKRFGGEVHEIGLMLIYLQPAMYCNVSDAWLFREKSKRLWVGLAGPCFELLLWALATLSWRATESDTWVHRLSLVVMAVTGVKTLINFNPLLKFDGYYLLSDYLEIPNLRAKSFRYLGARIESLFARPARRAEKLPRRERRTLLAYGLAGTVGSFAAATWVLVTAGELLVESHQPVVFLAATGLVGVSSRRRLRRMFGAESDPLAAVDEGGDASRPGADESQEPSKRRQEPQRKKRPLMKWAAWSAVAALLLFAVRLELRVSGPFTVVPEGPADVRATVEGIVEEVLVDEGDEVRAGDLVARLSGEALAAAGRGAEAEERETSARLRLLEAGATPEAIEVSRLGVTRAKERLAYATNRLRMYSTLVDQGLASRRELQDAEEQVAAGSNELAAARARLTEMSHGTRLEELEATRAQLDRLRTQLRFLEEEQRRLVVLSPVSGIVATPSRQLRAMQGKLVAKGGLIAKVYDLDNMTAAITIPEKEIADVSVGQAVVLRARAFPGTVFRGTVRSIAAVAGGGADDASFVSGDTAATGNYVGGARTLTVTTTIANPSHLLKPEMTGLAKVSCGQRSVFGLIARRLIRTFKVEFWSWW